LGCKGERQREKSKGFRVEWSGVLFIRRFLDRLS
jgi:hypothetical protein